jgi:hypothetical protein
MIQQSRTQTIEIILIEAQLSDEMKNKVKSMETAK